jgi:hypothetical protein
MRRQPETTESARQEPDLSGFLLAHAGFRCEFARLATAAREVRDAEHAALIDEQIDLVMYLLHHHHTEEDDVVWPLILGKTPEAADVLAALEEQHEAMDPLFRAVTDRSRPVADRVEDLEALHAMLNAHLDNEERDGVPLILAHYPAEQFAEDGERLLASMDRAKLPLIFGWLASCATPAEREAALRGVPWLARLLFRRVWGPAYAKRFRTLYGARPAIPVPT